ncbi:MAG: ATP-binding protein [Pseudomonadota bacterium]
MVVLNFYFQHLLRSSHQELYHILDLEKSFFDIIINEKGVLNHFIELTALGEKYKTVADGLAQGLPYTQQIERLRKREQLFSEVNGAETQRDILLDSVNTILPELVKSVRYIHEHHIAYMKNLFDRGKALQDYDTAESFTRSSVKSASELDIIKMAVAIQNRLLDIYNSFYDLQRGLNPSDIKAVFTERIQRFYTAINQFEDYSLDAQDGLLVEELLLNGRTFENAFLQLLNIEQQIKVLNGDLLLNRHTMLDRFNAITHRIQEDNSQLKTKIEVLQSISLITTGILVLCFLIYSRRMVNALQRTVQETQRIQSDLSYTITTEPMDFFEFKVIFNALNMMGRTIESQFRKLEEAQLQLSNRVAERTSELQEANEKLKKEIDDRIYAEGERLDLEKRLRRAQKMEAIGTLASGVAHDLNNILTGLVSFPELILLDLPQDHELRKPILTIQSSGKKAAVIVQDLLTLGRRGVTTASVINLNDIVQEHINSPEYSDILRHHSEVEVQIRMGSGLGNIYASKVHVAKTVTNLLSNAAEAMPAGGTIVVTTDNRYMDTPLRGYDHVKEGEYVTLSVSDNGVGINPQDLDRIFEPFFTKKKMGRSGTGLGMTIVWSTVKDHDGYIDVVSTEGRGTTFTLYFPLCRESLDNETSTESKWETWRANGETVLVVDDVFEQREIAVQMLERLGYKATTVSSGEAAVDYLSSHSVEILVLDMIMPPGMDGLETYRRILQQYPRQKAIIASGFAETDRVREAQRLGAAMYLRKPYTLEQLGKALQKELQRTT